MFLHSGRCRGVFVHSRLQYPKSRLTFSGFCTGPDVLALMGPVVPYTLVLSSKRSRPVVSPAMRFTAALFCQPVASQAPPLDYISVIE